MVMRRNLTRRLVQAEGRAHALAPPALDRWQQQAHDRLVAVLGPAVAGQLRSELLTSYWLHTAPLMGLIIDGAPPSVLTAEFARYEAVPSGRLGPQTLAAVQVWLGSPAGQQRSIDPYWTFHHEGTAQGDFRRDLGYAWVLATGAELAAWASADEQEQWEILVCVTVCLTSARHPELFTDLDRTRAKDIAVAETVHEAYRSWLHWRVEYCSVAVRTTPLPPVLSPSERWAAEIRAAESTQSRLTPLTV